MDYDRSPRGVIGGNVGQFEAFRQIVVHLDRAELPFAADDILYDEVDLWTIKGGFARLFGEGHCKRFYAFAERFFGTFPLFRSADILRGIGPSETDPHSI